MKFIFIKQHRLQFSIIRMCQVLNVSRNGYYQWYNRKPSKREQENKMLLNQIKKIYEQSHQIYGSPRITHELNKNGYSCSRPRVARLMSKNKIYSKTKRKFKVTTNSKHNYPISPNLVNQQFNSDSPNKIWTSDITYIRTLEGWLYLTVILDLFNRQVVGWSMSCRLTAITTTIPALIQAYQRFKPAEGLIFHSDRGVQYACNDFRKYLLKYKITQSMGSKGNCYDNAVTESFFKTLKTEHIYFEKFKTRQQARNSIFEYIEIFYNRFRKHSTLGYKSPEEFKQQYIYFTT